MNKISLESRYVCYTVYSSDFFFFKQKTAYEMRISDWSSDVCSSDLVGDIAEIAFHRLGGAEPVEGVHHEICIAQPAVAVVPVAAGVRGFGNGRRQRRDDGAGLLEIAELQRDRGADHGLLPLDRKSVVSGKSVSVSVDVGGRRS